MWTKLPSRLIRELQMRFGEVGKNKDKPVEIQEHKMISISVS